MKKWIKIGKAEKNRMGNDIYYSACVTVGKTIDIPYGTVGYRNGAFAHPRWTAYDDANFWQNVATNDEYWVQTIYCCTHCRGHQLKLNYETLEVFELMNVRSNKR